MSPLRPAVRAFTLIELLVVIAIIALLAALIFPITGAVQKQKIRSKVRAEIAQAETAIEAYKIKLGHYPPDDPVNHAINPLLFELLGTTRSPDGSTFTTLDGRYKVSATDLNTYFKVGGLVNSMAGAASEEGPSARKYLNDLKPGQVGEVAPGVKVLVCSVPWSGDPTWITGVPQGLNPIRYNSSNPTNSNSGFEIWVDVMIGGKVHRVCNWSKEPFVVNTPLP